MLVLIRSKSDISESNAEDDKSDIEEGAEDDKSDIEDGAEDDKSDFEEDTEDNKTDTQEEDEKSDNNATGNDSGDVDQGPSTSTKKKVLKKKKVVAKSSAFLDPAPGEKQKRANLGWTFYGEFTSEDPFRESDICKGIKVTFSPLKITISPLFIITVLLLSVPSSICWIPNPIRSPTLPHMSASSLGAQGRWLW